MYEFVQHLFNLPHFRLLHILNAFNQKYKKPKNYSQITSKIGLPNKSDDFLFLSIASVLGKPGQLVTYREKLLLLKKKKENHRISSHC